MKHLNVRELNSSILKKQQKRKESFEKVLQLCYGRIRGYASKEHVFCFYEIPEFVVGYPLYNISECVSYVTDILTKNGFSIQYYFPKVLYIAWGQKEKQTKQIAKTTAAVKSLHHRQSEFIDSVQEFRPSGKFVLNLT